MESGLFSGIALEFAVDIGRMDRPNVKPDSTCAVVGSGGADCADCVRGGGCDSGGE